MTSVRTIVACVVLACCGAVPTRAQAPPAVTEPGADAAVAEGFVVSRQADHVRYQADGTRVRHVARDVRILAPAGLEVWRNVATWYAGDREKVTLTRLEVVKPDGERIAPTNLTLEDRRQSGVFDLKVFGDLVESHVTVPQLAVGDTLSYEVRVDTTVPEAGGAFWEAHTFYTAAPIDEEVLQVEVPVSVPVSVWTRPGQPGPESDEVEGTHRILRWRRTNVRPDAPAKPPSMEEMLVADDKASGADVHVSSLANWGQVGNWYRAILARVQAPGPSVAAKARELTESAASQDEKLRALYRFVARDIHYVSLAFGVGRYEPRTADLVLETGYGDCKDKHTLLAALAREIGVVLDPVLIGSSARLDDEAPTPAQFDHLISVWRRGDDPAGWLWLDSTSGMTGAGVLLPNLREQQALVVDAASTFPVVTTPHGRRPSKTVTVFEGTLAADGTQDLTVRRHVDGDRGLVFRMLQSALQGPEQTKEAATSLLEQDGIKSSTVQTATLDIPEDFEAPVLLSYTAQVKYGLASTIQKQSLWVPASEIWLPDPDKLPTPWRLPFEADEQHEVTTTYTLPEGWHGAPPVDVDLVQPFGRYRSRYRVEGRRLTIERQLAITAGELQEGSRAAYARFRKSIIEDRAQQFGLKFADATSATAAARETTDLFDLARREFDARRFAQARDLLVQLTTAEPSHPHGWNDLGRAYLALGDATAARGALEKQVTVDPLHAYAYSNLGDAYRVLGRNDDAEAAYRKQIEIVPLDRYAHRALGLLFVHLGRLPEAITSLERATSISRDDRFARLHLGGAYLRTKQTARAIEIFDDLAATMPPTPGVLNDMAYWLAEADVELPRARSWAERGAALAHGGIGAGTLAQMRDWNVGPMETVVHLWDTVGWIAFKQGELPAARQWLEAAYAWSDNPEVALHLGMLREKEGRAPEALMAYRRAAPAKAPATGASPVVHAAAVEAIARLETAGVVAPRAADPLQARESRLKVAGIAARTTGELIAAIGTDGLVQEVLLLGDASVLAPLAEGLKGTEVPGADITRTRQLRLFRKAAVDCNGNGTCTVVWHRVP